nr:LysR family transcriptional regulator [Acinetobacter sp. Marseille-Q1620]
MIEKISLNSLKFFYFVAKFGSVTIAAQKLFVTQSAVSKQINNLEEAVQAELFERRNKSLILTSKGHLLFNCCQKLFAELDECLLEINKHNFVTKQLVLSCEPTISMKWLIPRLSKFRELGHDFDVVLLTGGGQVDFEKSNIDIAIRRNDFDWGEHIFSEKLVDEYMAVVQNPKIAKNHDILISKSRPNFWNNLNKLNDCKKLLTQYSKVELEHFYLCLEGCLAGLGVTTLSIYMIEKELEYSFLKMLVPAFKDGSAYYLLSHSAFEEDPRKLIFLEWLKQELAASQSALKLKS